MKASRIPISDSHSPCRTGESGTTDPAGQRGKDQSPRAGVPKHIKRKEQRKTNEIGGPYHIGCRKTQEKTPWKGEKQGGSLWPREQPLPLLTLSFVLLPNRSWFLSLLWCLTSEWPVEGGIKGTRQQWQY